MYKIFFIESVKIQYPFLNPISNLRNTMILVLIKQQLKLNLIESCKKHHSLKYFSKYFKLCQDVYHIM